MGSQLFKDLKLSTRRVFDDLFLFVRNKTFEIEKAGEDSELLQYIAEVQFRTIMKCHESENVKPVKQFTSELPSTRK